jgi:hypothetical protein
LKFPPRTRRERWDNCFPGFKCARAASSSMTFR